MRLIALLPLAISLAAATPALAKDQPASSDTTSISADGEVYSFTGLRGEFLAGYIRELPSVATYGPVFTTSQALRHSGASVGLQGGYDRQVGPVVAGVFGGYALLTSQGCGTIPIPSLNQGCLRPEAEAEGGGRIGYQFRGRFLGYAKASYVNTRIQTSTVSGSTIFNSHLNKGGFRFGGGVEFAVTPHTYLKVEYDHTRTVRFNAAPYGFQNTNIGYHDQSVLGGFGIRF